MDRLVELGRLLDYYGAFLTERQRSFARQYAYEDCSLAEIAEREGVSRQAVRDAIARAEGELAACEDALHLIRRTDRMRAIIADRLNTARDADERDTLARIRAIWEDDDGV